MMEVLHPSAQPDDNDDIIPYRAQVHERLWCTVFQSILIALFFYDTV
jgi:hypothetical protein